MQALGLCWGDIAPASIFTEARFVEYPDHRGARLLFDVWRATPYFQVGRHLPSRALSRVLSGLALYEPSETDFRVRLAGHGLLRHFGRDVTGTRLAALADMPHAGRRSGAVTALLERGKAPAAAGGHRGRARWFRAGGAACAGAGFAHPVDFGRHILQGLAIVTAGP